MATNVTSIGVPLEPWDIAKNRFLEGLSTDDERQLFENASLETLFYVASAGFKHHEGDSKMALARKRMKPLLDSIDGYSKALDVLSQSSTSILCPLWGSLRIVLHLAIEYDKYFNKLLKMYERIGDTLPRFRAYEALFPNHDRLLSALADAYLEIVKFSYDASRVFVLPQGKLKQSLNPIKDRWKPFERQFDEYMDKFRRFKHNVAEEAHVAHMIESKKTQELVLADRALQKRNAEMDDFRKIRNLLSTYDYHAKHRSIRSLCHEGTTTWFMQKEGFRKWLESASSDTFYCFGIPGAGKTVIASSVIDQAFGGGFALPASICYHYCDYADAYTLAPRNIICNMARQQLDKHLLLPSVLERCQPALRNNFPLSEADAIFCLGEALEKENPTLIVVDGIDEMTTQAQDLLLQTLDAFRKAVSSPIKILVFCRPDERLMRQNFGKDTSITIRLADNRDDLSRFIEQRVKACIGSGQLILNDLSLEKEIIEALKTGAEHMFLWAKFQIEELCYAHSEDAIRDVLRNLPKTLKETYDRISHRIHKAPGGDCIIELAQKILRWLTCARRPLTLDELKEAVAIEAGDKSLRRDRIAKDDLFIFEACANFVTLSEQDGTLRFSHHTVRQYLIGERLDGPPTLNRFQARFQARSMQWFSLQNAQEYVSNTCLIYLEFSDFDTQIARTSVVQQPSTLFAPSVIKHARIVQHTKFVPLLAALHGATGEVAPGRSLTLTVPSLQGSADIHAQFQLLDYVVENWTSHCNDACASRLRRDHIIFHRQSSINFRPWRAYNPHNLKERNTSSRMFRWTIDHNLDRFLDAFAREDLRRHFRYDRDLKHTSSDAVTHPLLRACSNDAKDVADRLSTWCSDLFYSTESGVGDMVGMVVVEILRESKSLTTVNREKLFATLYHWYSDNLTSTLMSAMDMSIRNLSPFETFIIYGVHHGHLKATRLLSAAVKQSKVAAVRNLVTAYSRRELFECMDVWMDCVSAVEICIMNHNREYLKAMEGLFGIRWVGGTVVSPFRHALLNCDGTTSGENAKWLYKQYAHNLIVLPEYGIEGPFE